MVSEDEKTISEQPGSVDSELLSLNRSVNIAYKQESWLVKKNNARSIQQLK